MELPKRYDEKEVRCNFSVYSATQAFLVVLSNNVFEHYVSYLDTIQYENPTFAHYKRGVYLFSILRISRVFAILSDNDFSTRRSPLCPALTNSPLYKPSTSRFARALPHRSPTFRLANTPRHVDRPPKDPARYDILPFSNTPPRNVTAQNGCLSIRPAEYRRATPANR